MKYDYKGLPYTHQDQMQVAEKLKIIAGQLIHSLRGPGGSQSRAGMAFHSIRDSGFNHRVALPMVASISKVAFWLRVAAGASVITSAFQEAGIHIPDLFYAFGLKLVTRSHRASRKTRIGGLHSGQRCAQLKLRERGK